jgi:hypothetical protein
MFRSSKWWLYPNTQPIAANDTVGLFWNPKTIHIIGFSIAFDFQSMIPSIFLARQELTPKQLVKRSCFATIRESGLVPCLSSFIFQVFSALVRTKKRTKTPPTTFLSR